MLHYVYFLFGAAVAAVFLLASVAIAVLCLSSPELMEFLTACRHVIKGHEAQRLIPVSDYRRKWEEPEGDCSVCLSVLVDGEQVRQLPYCKHVFHPSCIDRWLASHSTCPLCRQSVLPSAHRTAPESGSLSWKLMIGFCGRDSVVC